MTLFWHLVCFATLFAHSVRCDSNESNPSKSERDESSDGHQLGYESQNYPQSMAQSMLSSNGYNGNQNQMSLSESNSPQIYGSGHQTNDQFDQKERKTLILAIPMKLKLNEQDSYDQSSQQSESESQMGGKSLLYSKGSVPYQSPYPQTSRHPSFSSQNSDDSDPNLSKESSLPPLSHKIYSSIESQLKSASYSTVNTQKSVSEQPSSQSSTNEQKYKSSFDTKDYKSTPNQYIRDRDVNTNRNHDYPMIGDYQGMFLKGERDHNNPDSGYEVVKSYSFRPPGSDKIPNEDTYDSRIRQKESAKHLYESIPKTKPSEYDYDSGSDEEESEENEKTVKITPIFPNLKDYQNNNKQGFNINLKNNKKNQYPVKPNEPKASIDSQYSKNNKGLSHSLPVYAPDQPFDSWPQYYYSNQNMNDWTGVGDSVDTNMLSLLRSYKKPSKNNGRSPLYAPAFDILGDSQLKAAATTFPMKALPNSKIYGQAAKYQPSYPPLNLFAGYGQDYGLVEVNGDLYPAPSIVGQSPPRKAHNPLNPQELMAIEYNPMQANRDSIKPHRRNPLLLRPNFMSGLRSVATKPLANYSPFASASTTQSFLSVLPSLPSLQTSFNINAKSIPRQIFPLLYG